MQAARFFSQCLKWHLIDLYPSRDVMSATDPFRESSQEVAVAQLTDHLLAATEEDLREDVRRAVW